MDTYRQDRISGYFVAAAAFAAFLTVIAGVVAGILFAPKSGKETRAQLGEWLQGKRDQGAELLAKVKEEGLRRKEQVASAIKAGREAYSEADRHA